MPIINPKNISGIIERLTVLEQNGGQSTDLTSITNSITSLISSDNSIRGSISSLLTTDNSLTNSITSLISADNSIRGSISSLLTTDNSLTNSITSLISADNSIRGSIVSLSTSTSTSTGTIDITPLTNSITSLINTDVLIFNSISSLLSTDSSFNNRITLLENTSGSGTASASLTYKSYGAAIQTNEVLISNHKLTSLTMISLIYSLNIPIRIRGYISSEAREFDKQRPAYIYPSTHGVLFDCIIESGEFSWEFAPQVLLSLKDVYLQLSTPATLIFYGV